MKVSFDIKNTHAVIAELRGLAKTEIKRCAINALNNSAFAGLQATQKEIGKVFDRPTPWVTGSVAYKKAGMAGQNVRTPGIKDMYGRPHYLPLSEDRLEAVIDFMGHPNKQGVSVDSILSAEIFGGQRRYKRHEIALQRAGILPMGMAIAPGPAAKIDQYGNMASAQINQILSWFRAFGEQGYRANSTDKSQMANMRGRKVKGVRQRGFELFAIQKQVGKLHPGVYVRKDYSASESKRMSHLAMGGASALMYFIPLPKYSRRLDFYGVAEKAALAVFEPDFRQQLAKSLLKRAL